MPRPPPLAVALFFAAAWAVVPAIPVLGRGEIIGHGFTDLYPSVWGMDVLAQVWPSLPTSTDRLGAPAGVGFWYSSPLHAWLGAPLTWAFGPAFAYNLTVLAARFATVLTAYGWLRALGRRHAGSLAGALLFGASPFFQGYAVEGIVEGTDGWTLALFAWAVARKRPVLGVFGLALCVASSWYLGMVACFLAVGAAIRWRPALASLVGGLALASPLLWAFLHAFGGNGPLDAELRVAMGAPLAFPTPGLADGLHPFAITTFVGFAAVLLAAPSIGSQPAFAIGALACFVLSTGRGPWWELPVLEMVRFPYRWHAGTLLCLAALVSRTVDVLPWKFLGFLPWMEGIVCAPIEPVLPGASAAVPSLYDRVSGPVLLEIPGPVALPPGTPNPSRARARYTLYAQTVHGAASPWVLDWNGVSQDRNAPWLGSFLAWDPLLSESAELGRPTPDLDGARAAGVRQVMVHRDELRRNAESFESALVAAGATLIEADGPLALYGI